MVIVRDKARKTLNVTVGEAPGLAEAETAKQSSDKLGFSVANITPELVGKYRLDENASGVVVASVVPGSTAMQSGIEPGQVIARANDVRLKTAADFKAATKDLKSGDALRLVVQTKERRLLIEFEID